MKNDFTMEIEHIEQLFSKENWEAVQRLTGNVIPQLQKLARQSGHSAEGKTDFCNMLKQVIKNSDRIFHKIDFIPFFLHIKYVDHSFKFYVCN